MAFLHGTVLGFISLFFFRFLTIIVDGVWFDLGFVQVVHTIQFYDTEGVGYLDELWWEVGQREVIRLGNSNETCGFFLDMSH